MISIGRAGSANHWNGSCQIPAAGRDFEKTCIGDNLPGAADAGENPQNPEWWQSERPRVLSSGRGCGKDIGIKRHWNHTPWVVGAKI